ncbi:phosphoethanolamine transferase [Piscinibacter koreensis]|uniref:Phosphoethanolamine--lipid A transferase n=1 Tax=Piscinibacter koreensis TaxID=2742824 RepID=A0A7Y6NTJ7_9BURK|nr:phosphoethanolamine--lipid A transferase [Schlegelella koreensis]NUZ09075.1 phosphoethanolamine--lipid A transferase [Schlegelella koreensis]
MVAAGSRPASPLPKSVFRRGPLVSQTAFALGVSLWLLAVDNAVFWRGAWAGLQSGPLRSAAAVMALAIAGWLFFGLLLRLLFWRWTARPLATAVLLSAALAAYFIDAFGVVIDRGAIRNVLQTDWQETADLLSLRLLRDLSWRGLPPVALVWWVRIERPGWRQSGIGLARHALVTALLVPAALGVFFADYASLARNHRELRHVLTPTNIVNGVAGVWKERQATPRALAKVAEDASRPASAIGARKPLMVVLVVGETARAASFSLGGYDRPTNAALAGKKVVYFANTTACGTDTASSLPCLFSDLGATRFTVAGAFGRQNVLDVLARTGVAVRWLENNSGCKGVCDAVETRILSTAADAGVCSAEECLDSVLVDGLRQALADNTPERLLVLHMKGSHGPAYYKRVPATARRYTPTCDTNQIQGCDMQALRNTYDNTIVYTSEVLAQMIDELAARSASTDSVFIYVSDHGESLGESGLFLHGMPRWMAPREQTQIPMLVWLSDGAAARLRVSRTALQATAGTPSSHDNIFHTLLGLYEVRTTAYKAELDLLDHARTARRGMPLAASR